MTITLAAIYLIFSSPGLGFDAGYGAGIAAEITSQPVSIWISTSYQEKPKQDQPSGQHLGAEVQIRWWPRDSWFLAGGLSTGRTFTPRWTKTATRGVVALGLDSGRSRLILRGFLPDNTQNTLHGVGLAWEHTVGRRLWLRAQGGYWQFNGSRSDWTAGLGVGIRLEAEE